MSELDIFLSLLELPDSAARAEYLNVACGDDAAFRAKVAALLQSHETAGDFLNTPLVGPMESTAGWTKSQNGANHTRVRANGTAVEETLKFLSPSDRPNSLGRIGHYEVLEVLGKGGFGVVFRAFDAVLQRVVAIKVLLPEMAATSPARKRFLREARSSARVRHENVVQIYAVEEQPLPHLVMEFIPGETLQQRIDRVGPLDTAEVLHIGRQIAAALAAAHDQELIHRDIKPGNVLIEQGTDGHVKITDFGLARTVDDASLSESGLVAGTPMYMAPEQANGERVDHRADLFSLGSVLYTMCCGRPPFRAANTLAVLNRVVEDTPRSIQEIIPESPTWLSDIISRLHAKDRMQRFASAREVADLLNRCQVELEHSGKVDSLRPSLVDAETSESPPNSETLHSSIRRKHRWALAAGVLLLLIAGLGLAEATRVTNLRGTIIRLFSPDGTLVVEVDDPDVSVTIEGSDIVITGAGVKKFRLKPGRYKIQATKHGKVVRQELVNVMKDGRRVVRISREAGKPSMSHLSAAAWAKFVATLPAAEQVKAVAARLRARNPKFDGHIQPTIKDGVVTGLEFKTDAVTDISPVRGLTELQTLICRGTEGRGKLADLSPLRGLKLRSLDCSSNPVSDLSPMRDLPLTKLVCRVTRVADLSPLKDLKLTHLECGVSLVRDLTPLKTMKLTTLVVDHSLVSDLSPLKGMPLTSLHCGGSGAIIDLSPLTGMRLTYLHCGGTGVRDLSPIRGMPLTHVNCPFEARRDAEIVRSITTLQIINYKPADEFWKDVDGTSAPRTGKL